MEKYKVGRKDLLNWINGTLGLNYTLIEQVLSLHLPALPRLGLMNLSD